MSSKSLISFAKIAEDHSCFLEPEAYPSWPERFENSNPISLEIGFGNGNFLLEMAIRYPDQNFVGVDFYHKGIRKVITRMDRLHVQNIQIAYGDAKEKMPFLFNDGELQNVFINFPDPWPKKRHLKRRLIKPPFVKLLTEKLGPDGQIHVATDFESYAMEILEFMNQEPGLTNCNPEPGYRTQREDTPKTKYEKNFLSAGKTIYYLDFKKNSAYSWNRLSDSIPLN